MSKENKYLKITMSHEKAKKLQENLSEFLSWCKTPDEGNDSFDINLIGKKMISFEWVAYQEDGGQRGEGNL